MTFVREAGKVSRRKIKILLRNGRCSYIINSGETYFGSQEQEKQA